MIQITVFFLLAMYHIVMIKKTKQQNSNSKTVTAKTAKQQNSKTAIDRNSVFCSYHKKEEEL
jgi:hypothetical protein